MNVRIALRVAEQLKDLRKLVNFKKISENLGTDGKSSAKYYEDNKEVIKEKTRNKHKNLTEEEKELKRQASKNRYNKLKQQYKG